jgi:hypothetical protein
MNLHSRDYRKLAAEEELEFQAYLDWEKLPGFKEGFRCSKPLRHFLSLFPNNLLDTEELKDAERLESLVAAFQGLLDKDRVTERDILKFVTDKAAYFIIGSLLKHRFNFGHHQAHLFPEFPLGTSYRADYLLVGRNSDGWHYVFVELEAPIGDITLGGGDLGAVFRKGLSQLERWDTWLEGRFSALSETLEKHKRPEVALPREFALFDKTRIHYVVVAGRRTDFDDLTYRIRRKHYMEGARHLLHYDNLVDSARSVIGELTY